MKRKNLILGITASLIFISTGLLFSQESVEQGGVIAEPKNEIEVQWLWGEVVGLDAQSRTMTVKYLDYETDQEKEISIGTDAKTTYENIKSIDELKPKDAVSVDYFATPEGRNIAKNISLEKPEAAPPSQKPEDIQEITPQDLQEVAPAVE